MKKISSNSIGFFKKGMPAIMFGFVAIFMGTNAMFSMPAAMRAVFVITSLLMSGVFYFILKGFVWDLMDEVYDCGDSLLIKNGGEEELIALSNIMHVNVVTYINPPRVTLRLVSPGRFGKEIAFSPMQRQFVNPFAKNPIAEDLIERVDRARAARAR